MIATVIEKKNMSEVLALYELMIPEIVCAPTRPFPDKPAESWMMREDVTIMGIREDDKLIALWCLRGPSVMYPVADVSVVNTEEALAEVFKELILGSHEVIGDELYGVTENQNIHKWVKSIGLKNLVFEDNRIGWVNANS